METMETNSPFLEIYRGTSIGSALIDAIDEMISDGKMNPQLAYRVLENFDRHISLALKDQVKEVIKFKGELVTYRFVDNVWNIFLRNVQFILPQKENIVADKVKIVATCSLLGTAEELGRGNGNK